MTTLFFTFLTCIFLTIPIGYSAEKYLYFLGGGGEPQGETTIFDGYIPQMGKLLNSKGVSWKSSHSFNGEHTKTEELLAKNLGKSKDLGKFTKDNFENYIAGLEKQISEGTIRSGDQLLIILNTHGAVPQKDEKTHSIALSGTIKDLKTLSGAQIISMDRLENLISLASEKGIKLAMADLSCFSGNTMKLANKNVCLISATGSKNYGFAEIREEDDKGPYNVFAGRFMDNLKKGANLESAFLNARKGSAGPDFPMISTPEGLAINDLIYDFISSYLNFNSGAQHDFSNAYDKKAPEFSICKSKERFQEIMSVLDKIEKMGLIPKKLFDSNKLKVALNSYRNYQLQFESALLNTQKAGAEVKELIATHYPEQKKLFEKEDGLSIISTSRDSMLQIYKQLMEESTAESTKNFYKKVYEDLLLKDQIAKDVKEKLSPQAKNDLKKYDDTFKRSGQTKWLADMVGEEAKKLYDQLYRSMIKNQKESNPCRDFIL